MLLSKTLNILIYYMYNVPEYVKKNHLREHKYFGNLFLQNIIIIKLSDSYRISTNGATLTLNITDYNFKNNLREHNTLGVYSFKISLSLSEN